MICKNCGAEMQYYKDGQTITWLCNNCGNGVATTMYEPIEIDNTTYNIRLVKPFKPSLNDIKIISDIAKCNYIQAKKLIEYSPSLIFSGKAVDIKIIKEKLKNNNIIFSIVPDFPY